MINALPRGTKPLAVTLAAVAAALGAAGCGTYRSENTVARKPPPTTATTATSPAAAKTTPAKPPTKPHRGWPKLVNCLAAHGYKVTKPKANEFMVTTARGTDGTQVVVFSSTAAAQRLVRNSTTLNDRVGRIVASYGKTAGSVRDGVRACRH